MTDDKNVVLTFQFLPRTRATHEDNNNNTKTILKHAKIWDIAFGNTAASRHHFFCFYAGSEVRKYPFNTLCCYKQNRNAEKANCTLTARTKGSAGINVTAVSDWAFDISPMETKFESFKWCTQLFVPSKFIEHTFSILLIRSI